MRYADLKEGDKLVADGGFTCIPEGEVCTVFISGTELVVKCKEGIHSLLGQVDDYGEIVGFSYFNDNKKYMLIYANYANDKPSLIYAVGLKELNKKISKQYEEGAIILEVFDDESFTLYELTEQGSVEETKLEWDTVPQFK